MNQLELFEHSLKTASSRTQPGTPTDKPEKKSLKSKTPQVDAPPYQPQATIFDLIASDSIIKEAKSVDNGFFDSLLDELHKDAITYGNSGFEFTESLETISDKALGNEEWLIFAKNILNNNNIAVNGSTLTAFTNGILDNALSRD